MNVKSIDVIKTIMQERNGMVLTADLAKSGIPRAYLSILELKGVITRVERGVYLAAGATDDGMLTLQARYKNAIFSHETALYLLDLADRSPLSYSVTVPTGYNATSLKSTGAKVYFVKREVLSLGETLATSSHGNEVRSYGLERTICDVLRSRNQMDVDLVTDALKRYVKKPERNLDRLYQYAELFHVQKILRTSIEVLL